MPRTNYRKGKSQKTGAPGSVEKAPEAKKLKITLFLEKINQEMIRTTPSARCLYVSWKKSCCILDFSLVKPGDLVTNPARGLVLRKEDDGGMMWNPRSGAVYKLNEDAYHAILDLESGSSEYEIARRNDLELGAVRAMLTKLKRIAA